MQIEKLNNSDKELVQKWRYKNEFEQFNYAFKKDGWIDLYHLQCYSCKKKEEIIGLFFFIKQKNNEFRILINPNHLNKGFAKEILGKAIDMGFNELKLNEIFLLVRKNHHIAINLYERFGFKIFGETKEMINSIEVEFFKMIKENK